MKIEQRGVVITEVPYFGSITVDSPDSIRLDGDSYPIEGVTALRDALTEALKQAAQMSGSLNVRLLSPGVWNSGDPEPTDITEVRDRDGDVWERDGAEWWLRGGSDRHPWSFIVSTYGPLVAA